MEVIEHQAPRPRLARGSHQPCHGSEEQEPLSSSGSDGCGAAVSGTRCARFCAKRATSPPKSSVYRSSRYPAACVRPAGCTRRSTARTGLPTPHSRSPTTRRTRPRARRLRCGQPAVSCRSRVRRKKDDTPGAVLRSRPREPKLCTLSLAPNVCASWGGQLPRAAASPRRSAPTSSASGCHCSAKASTGWGNPFSSSSPADSNSTFSERSVRHPHGRRDEDSVGWGVLAQPRGLDGRLPEVIPVLNCRLPRG